MQAQTMECLHDVHVLVAIPIRSMRIRHANDLSYKFAVKVVENWFVVNFIIQIIEMRIQQDRVNTIKLKKFL